MVTLQKYQKINENYHYCSNYSWKTSKTSSDSACGASTESTTSSAEPLTSLSTDSAMSMMSSNSVSNSNNGHSYSSLKSRFVEILGFFREINVPENQFLALRKRAKKLFWHFQNEQKMLFGNFEIVKIVKKLSYSLTELFFVCFGNVF